MGYKPRFIDAQLLKKRLREMGRLGLKSVMFAGEGEPFLHPEMADIAQKAKASGIDVAFTTNAALLRPEIAAKILPITSWVKVSINAGTPAAYAKIHRTRPEDFNTVLKNMEYAAALRRKNGYSCALGMQLVLLPENAGEAVTLARRACDSGMDYLVIKPYSQHPQSVTDKYGAVKYEKYEKLERELSRLNSADFSVIFRLNAMHKWDAGEKPYARCLALPFWTYIDAGGNVWGCSMFLGKKEFLYGNIGAKTFMEIWNGPLRRKSLAHVEKKLDARRCRLNCRMDEINRYLHQLENPPEHVNFI
jgi:radical SAM protein with 4Fe4S-binding SPASM domain